MNFRNNEIFGHKRYFLTLTNPPAILKLGANFITKIGNCHERRKSTNKERPTHDALYIWHCTHYLTVKYAADDGKSQYEGLKLLLLQCLWNFDFFFTCSSVTYRDQMTSGYADCYGVYSGFYSTSLLFGMGCVDGPGSLSGGAFNQLKLVNYKVLNIPLLT